MATLSKWIKQAVTSIVDPERDARVAGLVGTIQRDLFQQKQGFVLTESVRGLEYRPPDLEFAKEQVYRNILSRAWSDGVMSAGEQQVATWAARVLLITPPRANMLNVQHARGHFAGALADAMDDGTIDPREERLLNQIAGAAGYTLADFAKAFFHSESESFLRGVFSACVANNQLSPTGWNNLLAAASKLGVPHEQMLQVIQPQAERFVEHVLADAKADGRLSSHEESVLSWMAGNLGLTPHYQRYLLQELESLRQITAIAEGRLPSIAVPMHVSLRAGEIVHFHDSAVWRRGRLRQGEALHEDYPGTCTLTDNRLIFTGVAISQSVKYRSVVAFQGGDGWFSVQTEGRPASTFIFQRQSPFPNLIFRVALAASNQLMVAKSEGGSSRHISRDVRQRVWQRYGGRCAECNAADYLEFDHIIPVAKGGSNADSNVQLLCRRCNLKKSDYI